MTRHELPSQFVTKPPNALTQEKHSAFATHFAAAARDWESDICELAVLADLTATISSDHLSTSASSVTINDGQATHILFCVNDLLNRASALKADYFAAWEEAKAAEMPSSPADDTALFALRPMFEACRANMEAACDAVEAAENKEGVGGDRPLIAAATAVQAAAVQIELALSALASDIPARTTGGLQFKRELRRHWRGCERPDLDKSIATDELALTIKATRRADTVAGDLLLQLGDQFETAWRDQVAVFAAKAEDMSIDAGDVCDAAYKATMAVVSKIEAARAVSVEGLIVKARAASWCHQGDTYGPKSFGRTATQDRRLGATIIRDLISMSCLPLPEVPETPEARA